MKGKPDARHDDNLSKSKWLNWSYNIFNYSIIKDSPGVRNVKKLIFWLVKKSMSSMPRWTKYLIGVFWECLEKIPLVIISMVDKNLKHEQNQRTTISYSGGYSMVRVQSTANAKKKSVRNILILQEGSLSCYACKSNSETIFLIWSFHWP